MTQLSTAYHLEISPLKEREYTGIPQVTAALAEQFLNDEKRDVVFCYGRMVVERNVVEDVLKLRDGGLLEWYLERSLCSLAPVRSDRMNVALFVNRKPCRRAFDREYQIVHDLSTLLTPQFHTADTVAYHALTFEGDIKTNDITFCVSEATREDVELYLARPNDRRLQTLHIAADRPSPIQGLRAAPAEDYILVLGTVEPRKNITAVLEYIGRNPSILDRFRFVLPGRFGWGENLMSLFEQTKMGPFIESGQVVFPGFVDEAVKNALIENAYLVVYPSLFEGFGLPILEAMSYGVPVLTTRSTSHPEVGADAAFYFDPFSPGSFDHAFRDAVANLDHSREAVSKRCLEQASHFSWEKTYAKLVAAIDEDIAIAQATASDPHVSGMAAL